MTWIGPTIIAVALLVLAVCSVRVVYDRDPDETIRKLGRVFLADPDSRHFGYYLSRKAGVRSGVVYPALSRLLTDGWLECGWEDPHEAVGRPPRRWYRLTDEGFARLLSIAEKAGDPS